MKPILLGLTVWGDHLDTFFNYSLPSLMAEGNLPALAKEREILFHIHTNKDGFPSLFNKLPYPHEILVDVNNDEKYLQLGRHQNQDLREAKKRGADYICLMPDFIYSDNCFTGVLKSGKKAIARLVLSTIAEDILPKLDIPRSAIDLATLGFQHVHHGIRNWFITNVGYPKTHVIAYVGKETLTMCSPHLHPVYIANEVINPMTSEMPLDCILDKIIIGEIYCPKPEDGIVMVEVSPKNSRMPNYAVSDLKEFCRCFRWDTNNSPRQLYIFTQETIDPIHLQTNCCEDNEIENIKAIVYNALLKNLES